MTSGPTRTAKPTSSTPTCPEQPGTAQDPYLQITYTLPAPTIASLSTGPTPVEWPRSLNIIATGVTDPDGSVTAVSFYRETNNTPGLQIGVGGDTFVANATLSAPNTWTYSADVTTWQPGQPTIYALATDNQGCHHSLIGLSAPSAQAAILPLGDANGDYKVDSADYLLIDNGFNMGLTGWSNGDFNNDGLINGDDYTLIDNSFNSQGTAVVILIAKTTPQPVKNPTVAISSHQPTTAAPVAVLPATSNLTPLLAITAYLIKRLHPIWALLQDDSLDHPARRRDI